MSFATFGWLLSQVFLATEETLASADLSEDVSRQANTDKLIRLD